MALRDRKQRVKNYKKTVVDGVEFSSQAEAYYYWLLKRQEEKGEIRSFEKQIPFILQPKFKKCSEGCGFIIKEDEPNFKKLRHCPLCGLNNKMVDLVLVRGITYICDFIVTDNYFKKHVIDVKSSAFFQTEMFKMKRKLFELAYPNMRLEEVYPKVPKNWYIEYQDSLLKGTSNSRGCLIESGGLA